MFSPEHLYIVDLEKLWHAVGEFSIDIHPHLSSEEQSGDLLTTALFLFGITPESSLPSGPTVGTSSPSLPLARQRIRFRDEYPPWRTPPASRHRRCFAQPSSHIRLRRPSPQSFLFLLELVPCPGQPLYYRRERTSVYVAQEDLAVIRQAADRRGVPAADIIREGIRLAAMANRVWDDPLDWPTFEPNAEVQ